MFLYEFVSSLSDISARSKIELWSTTAPFSHPAFLLQSNEIQIEKIGTKVIFHQNCQRLTSNVVSNNHHIVLQIYNEIYF